MLVSTSFGFSFIAAVALFAEFLALLDIAKVSAPVSEWYVVGTCMIVTAVFEISTLITLGFVLTWPEVSPEIQATPIK
jgi:hypothetical protein